MPDTDTSRERPGGAKGCIQLPMRGEPIAPAVPAGALTTTIPDEARRIEPPARPAPGVELVAASVPASAREGGMLTITTWWRVTAPVGRHVMPAFHLETEGETPRRGLPWYTRHDAADWSVPLHLLEPGALVRDVYPARLQGIPAGPCQVWAVVIDTTRPEGERILGEKHLLGEVEILLRGEE